MEPISFKQSFIDHFNAKPEFIVRAPGRVNLIGEHTDYNDGFVLPMAVDRAIWIALSPRTDSQVRIRSIDLAEDAAFDLHSLIKDKGWAEYIKGVAFELQSAGFQLRGFDAVISGDVPRGAGLSSSAAVELATAKAFSVVSGFEWHAKEMAALAQKAENNWVGMKCGIMDQMASAVCREGHALFLDCRSLEIQHAPLPRGTSVVIMDTSTRRGLVDSAYNERRSQCEEAARWFGVKALRDISPEEFESKTRAHPLDGVTLKRARHIVTENARVLQAVEAMRSGDLADLGNLFNASHESLRDDFEVTNEALDVIVKSAREQAGCYGARMTGAGFGGCAVALVDSTQVKEFVQNTIQSYKEKTGLDASLYVTHASEGASLA